MIKQIVGMTILAATAAMAAIGPPPTPEIDPGMAGSAIALLSGALIMIRGRRKN